MGRFSHNRVLAILVVVATLSAGALAIGRWAGRGMAEEMRARLELRWADLMTLPEGDRAAIVKAALACDLLQHSAATAGSVEACVREGAGKTGVALPQGDP